MSSETNGVAKHRRISAWSARYDPTDEAANSIAAEVIAEHKIDLDQAAGEEVWRAFCQVDKGEREEAYRKYEEAYQKTREERRAQGGPEPEDFPEPSVRTDAEPTAPPEGPTADDPLRGLPHLAAVADFGLARLRELAAQPVHFAWDHIAESGTIVAFASGPGEGKTSLLFLLLAARLSRGEPRYLLGHRVEPIGEGRYIVLIEGEHPSDSAARKLFRSARILGIPEEDLDRFVLVGRKAVRLGSPAWDDVDKMVAAGLVADIGIDTVARVAPANADSEYDQVGIFDKVAQTIDRAPSRETRPTAWAAMHTRKNGDGDQLVDVSGSAQRTGQSDSVLLFKAKRVGGRVVESKVTFGKVRTDQDAEDYPRPVTFRIEKDGITIVDDETFGGDELPLRGRIMQVLRVDGPQTRSALSVKLQIGKPVLEVTLSDLFAERLIRNTKVRVNHREFDGVCLAPVRVEK
jgi:hypothetical protein